VADGGRGTWWKLAREPLSLEASSPGIFFAGDVRHGSIKRVASAVGEGRHGGAAGAPLPGRAHVDQVTLRRGAQPDGTRRGTEPLSEDASRVALVGEPARARHHADRQRRACEQALGVLDATVGDEPAIRCAESLSSAWTIVDASHSGERECSGALQLAPTE
jgi:hypothetical protein